MPIAQLNTSTLVYISGPMSGCPDHNFPAFDAAESALKKLGYEVVSPANLTRSRWGLHGGEERYLAAVAVMNRDSYDNRSARMLYLGNDLRGLLGGLDGTRCTDVLLLPGWERSRGATLEALVAAQIGTPFWTWDAVMKAPISLVLPVKVAAKLHALAVGISHDDRARASRHDAASSLPTPESTLAEADRLVNGPRQESYGHPLDNFTNIARLWQAYLDNQGRADADFTLMAEDVALMMDLLKVAREAEHPKRDNRVDGPGYWATLDLVVQERARRAKATR